MVQFKNAVRLSAESITCDINHPVHGWIPFTATTGDTGSDIDVEGLYIEASKVAVNESVEVINNRATELAVSTKKSDRDVAVQNIVVTVGSMVFDGDETSQTRMSRAISASDPLDTTLWRLADNSIKTVSREELKEALYLAGQAQTLIWMA